MTDCHFFVDAFQHGTQSFICSVVGSKKGEVFDIFLRFKYYRFIRLGKTLGLFVFILHVPH
jgi:hypothetical protein